MVELFSRTIATMVESSSGRDDPMAESYCTRKDVQMSHLGGGMPHWLSCLPGGNSPMAEASSRRDAPMAEPSSRRLFPNN